MGGGGYGDPIDRDPELVLKDVLAGLVTDGPARDIYGVVIAGGCGGRRRDAGAAARAARRAARPAVRRRRRSEPDVDAHRHAARASTSSARRATLPSAPGAATEVAPAGADWKDHAVQRRLPVEKTGPNRTALGRVLPDRGLLPRLRDAARRRARRRRRPAAATTASGAGRTRDPARGHPAATSTSRAGSSTATSRRAAATASRSTATTTVTYRELRGASEPRRQSACAGSACGRRTASCSRSPTASSSSRAGTPR